MREWDCVEQVSGFSTYGCLGFFPVISLGIKDFFHVIRSWASSVCCISFDFSVGNKFELSMTSLGFFYFSPTLACSLSGSINLHHFWPLIIVEGL